MAALVTSLLLLTIASCSALAAPSDADVPSGVATPPLEGGVLETLNKEHLSSASEERRPEPETLSVENPEQHVDDVVRSAHHPENGPPPQPSHTEHKPSHPQHISSRIFFNPALLLNLTSMLTNNFNLNSNNTGLNVTLNVNPVNLTLTVTPIPSGPSIANPLGIPLPLQASTFFVPWADTAALYNITLPLTTALGLLNITGPMVSALASALTPLSPLTWLMPPPLMPPFLPMMFPGVFPGGINGVHHHHRATSTVVRTTTITSVSVLRSIVTEMLTRTYTLPKVFYSTVVIPSTSTSTIVVPKFETTSVVVTLSSTSTLIVPEYTTDLPDMHRPEPEYPPHHHHHPSHQEYWQYHP